MTPDIVHHLQGSQKQTEVTNREDLSPEEEILGEEILDNDLDLETLLLIVDGVQEAMLGDFVEEDSLEEIIKLFYYIVYLTFINYKVLTSV
jgi:hypothetical protein